MAPEPGFSPFPASHLPHMRKGSLVVAHLLVVDDEEPVRTLFNAYLSHNGHTVRCASNGQSALELYKTERFDVVITDLLMPEMEGIETIRELRRINPSAKIIAISGGGTGKAAHYLLIAQKIGAHYTFDKPVSLHKLLEAVESLVQTGN
jgi:DNA-binding NtrC family response regulator